MTGPPDALVRTLLDGPSPVASFEWHDEIDSTNRRALELAAAGAPEVAVVAADLQTRGRGRWGRDWVAPAGTSLLCSLLLRPQGVDPRALPLLSLLTGLVLAETVERSLQTGEVALKWPNDLLVREGAGAPWRKAAGILLEGTGEGAVVGVGCNVDWRANPPPELPVPATSLAEVAGTAIDRWRLLAAFLGVFGNRYAAWRDDHAGFLDGYRARCETLGQRVRGAGVAGGSVEGRAEGVAESGALLLRTDDEDLIELSAGEVHTVRSA